jgi:hypothetical protein
MGSTTARRLTFEVGVGQYLVRQLDHLVTAAFAFAPRRFLAEAKAAFSGRHFAAVT